MHTPSHASIAAARFISICLCASIVLAANALPAAAALATDEQALINVLRRYDPEMADRIEAGLNRFDKVHQFDKRNDKLSSEVFRDRRRIVEEEIEDLSRINPMHKIEARILLGVLRGSIDRSATPFPGQPNPYAGPDFFVQALKRRYRSDLAEKYQAEFDRLESERQKKAQEETEAKKSAESKQSSIILPRDQSGAYVAVAPSFVFGNWQGPRPIYLGFENALTVQSFAIENLKTDDNFTGFDAHFTANLNRGSALHFGVNAYDVSFTGASDMIDPLGQLLLFPGVTSAGFTVAGFVPEGTPGGLNVVDRLHYGYDSQNTTFYGAYSQACEHGPFTFIGYGGVAQTIANQQQTLDGFIPGYGFGFRYDTSFRTDVTRGMLGARTIYSVDPVKGLSVNAGATAFLNFADANGHDSLALDGVFEERKIGKSEVSFGWAAGVGAEYEAGNNVTLYANYRHFDERTTPFARREDDGPSHVVFKRAEADVGMVGVRLGF